MLTSIHLGHPVVQQGSLIGTRARIILVAAATVVLLLLIAAAALFWHAYQERHAIAHRGLSASIAAANAVEREVQALGYLLKGLSGSPLLRSGDLEGFYHQLRSTPHPEGAWFALWDLDRQILNTTRPFGAALPRIDELPRTRQRLEVVRSVGLSVSDRIRSPLANRWVVSVSLRLDSPAGEMNRVLALLVPEEHFNAAVRERSEPNGWITVILDRKLQWLSTGMEGNLTVPPMTELIGMRSDPDRIDYFESGTGRDASLVAFGRSPQTGYTVASLMPATAANAPILMAFYQTSLASLILVLIGTASVLALLRNVGPIDSLRSAAASTTAELLATNARLNAILESVSDCHFSLDRSYRITGINSATLRWCGRPRSEIVGRSYFDLVGHHSDCARAVAQAIEHRRAYKGELPSGLRPDRYIDFRADPSPEGASVFFSDVTDRHTAHLAVSRERKFLQSSLDALPQRIAVLDDQGRIIAVNQAWRRFLEGHGHRDSAHGVGSSYIDIGVIGSQTVGEMEAVIAGAQSSFQALCQWPLSEPQCWYTVRAFRFAIGDETRIIVSHEDVTELMRSRAAASELSDRLLTLREDERQRIAVELHDSTTQYLVAVGLNLMKVERLLPQRDGQRLLGEIDHLLEEALKELRLFTYLLHPAVLDETGFCDTVHAFADGFSNRTSLRVTCRIDEEADSLGIDLRRALLRIVQEALSNVHRHADASKVTVDLRCMPDEVILRVADNGHGMRPRPAGSRHGKPSLGVGIPGMRIRLHQFGGTLRIRSGRRGTVVRACVPRSAIGDLADGAVAGIGAEFHLEPGRAPWTSGLEPSFLGVSPEFGDQAFGV